MSDADPANLALIEEEMLKLKESHKDNSFFIINTSKNREIKYEVCTDKRQNQSATRLHQLDLL